jgi:hypothetical protein
MQNRKPFLPHIPPWFKILSGGLRGQVRQFIQKGMRVGNPGAKSNAVHWGPEDILVTSSFQGNHTLLSQRRNN